MKGNRPTVISALPGGNAEKVLREIALPRQNCTTPRSFREIEPGLWVGEIHATTTGEVYPLQLRLGVRVGLHLWDDPTLRSWSCKPRAESSDVIVLPIGFGFPEMRLATIANTIVGNWIVHGFVWQNKRGQSIAGYGNLPSENNARRRKRRSRGSRRAYSLRRAGWHVNPC